MPMRNGQTKQQLHDLSIPKEKVQAYQDKIGKEVEVEVAVIGKATFYGV